MLTDDDRFKGKVVEVYQNSEGGYGTLSQRFSIPAFLTVHKWVKIAENREKNHYKNVGRNTITLPNSSIIVIHYYLNSKEFYLNAALRYGLSSGELLQRWHQKFLREDMEGTRNRRQSEKVRRIMGKLELKGFKFIQKPRRYNSYKGAVGRVPKNHIHQRFYTSIPHQKGTTDITEFNYYERDKNKKLVIKKLYLDPFLDMFNGEILSHRISGRTDSKTMMDDCIKIPTRFL